MIVRRGDISREQYTAPVSTAINIGIGVAGKRRERLAEETRTGRIERQWAGQREDTQPSLGEGRLSGVRLSRITGFF